MAGIITIHVNDTKEFLNEYYEDLDDDPNVVAFTDEMGSLETFESPMDCEAVEYT